MYEKMSGPNSLGHNSNSGIVAGETIKRGGARWCWDSDARARSLDAISHWGNNEGF